MNDGSPNVGGAWAKDSYAQVELSLNALKIASSFLKPGGTFISKIFRSRDYNSILWVCRQLFSSVASMKPHSSRTTSAEIYIVCQGYHAPKQIDPRLLDPSFVFRDVEIDKTPMNVLTRKIKQKRNRQGYTDTSMLMYKKVPVKDFIECSKPQEYLADIHTLEFNDQSKIFLDHPETNNEIVKLCEDLQVLNKRDFKNLLK